MVVPLVREGAVTAPAVGIHNAAGYHRFFEEPDQRHRGQIIDDAEPDSTRAATGEIGRLRRRPGLYSSHLSAWWKAVRVDLGIRRSTFYGWYRRFKDRGVAGLADRHGSPARRRQGG